MRGTTSLGRQPVDDEIAGADPVALLARQHDELCSLAADRFEIAAGLEAEGVNDQQARRTFGFASVFELAEHLFETVPRRPSEPEAPENPWHRPVGRHLARGLLYVLPGLVYVVAVLGLGTRADARVLLGATAVSVALSQALSVLGHALHGRGEHLAARRLLRGAVLAGVGGGGALLLAARPGAVTAPGTAVLAWLQLVYLLAATVLLVLDDEHVLLAVLAPGVLVALGALTGALDDVPSRLVRAVLGGCVLATVVVALVRAGRPARGGAGRSGQRLGTALGGGELRLACGHLLAGLTTVGLASFAVVDAVTGPGRAQGVSVWPAMLPLLAGLGPADWLLHRLRGFGVLLQHQVTSAETFRTRTRSRLTAVVAAFAAAETAVAGVVVVVSAAAGGRPGPAEVLDTYAYALLGVCFLLVTVLLSLGLHQVVLVCTGTALVVDAVLRWTVGTTGGPGTLLLASAHLAVIVGLLMALLLVSLTEYSSVARHR